jgi:acyl-CoA-dependent ceramide synthase
MFAHHIITVNLMMFSYVLNWTRVGNAILVLMDFVDILLPVSTSLDESPAHGSLTRSRYPQLAKLFVYTKKPLAADITFGTFMLAWIATRHVLYGIVLWSVYFELPSMLPYDWRPQDGYFNSFYSHQAFFGLLLALQLIIIVWFTMICRVAYRAVTGRGVDDERSEAG